MTHPLRHTVEPSERIILAQIAASGPDGHLIERGHETKLHRFLVEDGYLTQAAELGTARTYLRFKLTPMGREALRLKTLQMVEERRLYSGADDQQALDFLDTDNDCRDPGGHVFVPDPMTGSRCLFCKVLP